MSTNVSATNEDLEFERMMEQKLKNNFGAGTSGTQATEEKLKEMNKKLPSWNLEPPYSFLK